MIVAIIPAYNEEHTIGSVVLKTIPYVDKVIVVDDGSKDKTAEIAKLAGVEVIQHIQNGGKGSAIKTGFEAAENLNANVVVCLDADAQHNPDFIPRLVSPIVSGEAEMVIASRYENKEVLKVVPPYRRFGLWVLNKTLNISSKCKVKDTQCGFRAFSGEILGKFSFNRKGFSIESEMIEDAIENNIKIKEVPFIPRYDVLNSSTEKPVKHGIGVLKYIVRTVRERHPLLFFGILGLILLILGMAFSIYSLNFYFTYGHITFGLSIAASVLILIGTFCIFAGLILSSISGMIQKFTKLNRVQEKKLTEEPDKSINPKSIPLTLFQQDILNRSISDHRIQGVKVMNLTRPDILYGDINRQSILMPTLNYNQLEKVHEDISNLQTPVPISLNHNNTEDIFREINGHEIYELTSFNHDYTESRPASINGYKINGVTQLNNHKRQIFIDDIE